MSSGVIRRHVVALVLGALIVAVSLPSSAGAVVMRLAGGRIAGVALRAQVSADSVRGARTLTDAGDASAVNFSSPDNGTVDYQGGVVLHTVAPYLVFWDPSGDISSASRSLLERYFTDSAADSGMADDVFGVDRQYTDGTGFADEGQSFSMSQVIVDTEPYPSQDATNCNRAFSGYPICVTDAQLETEVARLIAADGLPTDGGYSAPVADAPIYFMVTPPNVNICQTANVCGDNVFCAYHSSFTDGGDGVLYASIPMLLAQFDPKGCQDDGNSAVQRPNGDLADVVTSYMSHEFNETISDPYGTGYWDSTSGNEIGDECAFNGATVDPSGDSNPSSWKPTLGGSASIGTLYDQLINGDPYDTQTEWSNYDLNCEAQPSGGALTATFSSSAPVLDVPASFDPSASAAADGYSSSTWSFGDGSAPQFSAGAPATAQHTFTSLGEYDVKLTLVDGAGDEAVHTEAIVLGQRPQASFLAPSSAVTAGAQAAFDASASSDPNVGGSLASYDWSFGDGTTQSSPAASTTHTYTTAGDYTVSLTVVDSFGISSAPATEQVTVSSSAGGGTGSSGGGTGSSGGGTGSSGGGTGSSGDGSGSAGGGTSTHPSPHTAAPTKPKKRALVCRWVRRRGHKGRKRVCVRKSKR